MKNLNHKTWIIALIAALCIPFNGLSQRGNSQNKHNAQNKHKQHYQKANKKTPQKYQHKQPRKNYSYKRPNHRPNYKPRPVKRTYHRPVVVRRPNPYFRNYGMQVYVFQGLHRNMQNAFFDNERLEIAKIAIASNGVNTNQVIDLMARLTFDKNRLELAKFAYDYVINPEEYFLVIESLSFYSNRRALSDYIR